MPQEIRKPYNSKTILGNGGPYKAKVVGHLDPSFMGGLEVTLLKDNGNQFGNDNQTFSVRCATPFYGVTNFSFQGENKGNDQAFNDTQKSYGMWFVPPDIGVTVLVVFIDGDPAEGYWIACIPDRFANHMVPAIASSKNIDYAQADRQKYEPNVGLPVAEVNRAANVAVGANISAAKKPVHPVAETYLTQGLLMDDIRGPSTSTPRRNLPGSVFGISTPGPIDPLGKKAYIGKKESKSETQVPVSRLGGTTFVMDDGDSRFQRKTPASEGPMMYADLDNNEKGDPSVLASEYFRIRTRTGHQILLHNSEDLIYIGNARGTTWIELTSNGKIDIFAEDSISIHTKNDLNIRADRDINMEAKRNINIKTLEGRVQTEVATDLINIVTKDVKEYIKGSYHQTVDTNVFSKVLGDTNSTVDGKIKISSTGTISLKTSVDLRLQAGTNTNIKSAGKHVEEAARIEMNCDPAASAEVATVSVKPTVLSTFNLAVIDDTLTWKDTQYKSQETVLSIMKRIPMHEPWADHEHLDPTKVTPEKTDRDVTGE
jgi:hypothetical protein